MSQDQLKTEWRPHEIKSFRETLGMNQTEFAKELGLDRQQTISGWSRGVKPNKATRILLGMLYERRGRPKLGA